MILFEAAEAMDLEPDLALDLAGEELGVVGGRRGGCGSLGGFRTGSLGLQAGRRLKCEGSQGAAQRLGGNGLGVVALGEDTAPSTAPAQGSDESAGGGCSATEEVLEGFRRERGKWRVSILHAEMRQHKLNQVAGQNIWGSRDGLNRRQGRDEQNGTAGTDGADAYADGFGEIRGARQVKARAFLGDEAVAALCAAAAAIRAYREARSAQFSHGFHGSRSSAPGNRISGSRAFRPK